MTAVFRAPADAQHAADDLRAAGLVGEGTGVADSQDLPATPERARDRDDGRAHDDRPARTGGSVDAGDELRHTTPTPVLVTTPGMSRGLVAGTLIGGVAGTVIGLFLAAVAPVPAVLTVGISALAGTVVGFVLGGAFGSLARDQGAPHTAEDDTGAPLTPHAAPGSPDLVVDVTVANQQALRTVRSIIRRHRPVRVSVRR